MFEQFVAATVSKFDSRNTFFQLPGSWQVTMVVVTSLGPPEEGMRHVEPNTITYINEKTLGKGYVT